MTQNKPGAFPYPCSDDSRTVCLLGSDIVWFLKWGWACGECLFLSDRLCANSRTLDIGNACRIILLCVVKRECKVTFLLYGCHWNVIVGGYTSK